MKKINLNFLAIFLLMFALVSCTDDDNTTIVEPDPEEEVTPNPIEGTEGNLVTLDLDKEYPLSKFHIPTLFNFYNTTYKDFSEALNKDGIEYSVVGEPANFEDRLVTYVIQAEDYSPFKEYEVQANFFRNINYIDQVFREDALASIVVNASIQDVNWTLEDILNHYKETIKFTRNEELYFYESNEEIGYIEEVPSLETVIDGINNPDKDINAKIYWGYVVEEGESQLNVENCIAQGDCPPIIELTYFPKDQRMHIDVKTFYARDFITYYGKWPIVN